MFMSCIGNIIHNVNTVEKILPGVGKKTRRMTPLPPGNQLTAQ
jgi:hypothetical protein